MLLERIKSVFLGIYNQVDYPLRQLFRWQRSGYVPKAQPVESYYNHLPQAEQAAAEKRAAELIHEYHLQSFQQVSSPQNFRENLFYLDLLGNALNQSGANLPDPINCVDIGPSHWFYVQALYAGLTWWHTPNARTVHITGYEADAYRVYQDFHSRYDHALGHIRNLEGVTYIPRPFTSQPGKYDLAVMFFPFVFSKDHLEWGLPTGMFQPRLLLKSVWDSLQPGGLLIIVNQGEQEHQSELENLRALAIQPITAFRQDPLLYQYNLDRFVLVARHE